MERNSDKNVLYERYGLICSSFGSVLIHCVAFAVLLYSTNIYPVIAMPSAKEVLWFYPSLFSGSTTVSNETADNEVPLQQKTIAPAAEPRNLPGRLEPVVEEDDAAPDISLVRYTDMPAESTLMREAGQELSVTPVPVAPPSKTPSKPEKPAHEVRKAVAALPRPPVAPRQLQKEAGPPVVLRQPPVPMPAAASPFVTDTDQKANHQLSKTSDLRDVVSTGRNPDGSDLNRLATQQHEKKTALSAVPSALPVVKMADAGPAQPSVKNIVVKPQGSVHAGTGSNGTGPQSPAASTGKSANNGSPVIAKTTAPGSLAKNSFPVSGEPQKQVAAPVVAKDPVQAARPVGGEISDRKVSDAPGKEKGLFSPPLTGDIKFELVAREDLDRGVKVMVSFRDYPKARRGRPLSRTEAMRVRSIAPKIVMPKGNAIHVVIDHAAEGVYYMRVELERQQVSDASITVRLFEGGARARNMTVHVRTITNNEIVVRLMMPEGIVWEDASAFSGSLEDSDSVTKFNPDTGVEWKEYN